jgi:CheY-like chemotaxis protein
MVAADAYPEPRHVFREGDARPHATSGVPDPRLDRALVASVGQEFDAPTAAILGFADLLLEDARRQGLDALVPDLQQVRNAGLKLQAMLGDMLDRKAAPAEGEDFAEFCARLRHDLRTPLNAVTGFGELLIEDAEASGNGALIQDLGRILGAARELLGRIDTVGAADPLGEEPRRAPVAADASSRDLVTSVIAAIRPLTPGEAAEGAPPSRILVADDIGSNRDLLSRRLAREGHVVETVADGRAALGRVAAPGPGFDLVLLDLMLPEINGFEVLCRMKADPRLRRVPVIVISALHDHDSVVRCIEAGAEDYLPKPCDHALLRARIKALIGKTRLPDREHGSPEAGFSGPYFSVAT